MDDYKRKDMIHSCVLGVTLFVKIVGNDVETEIKDKGKCVVTCPHSKVSRTDTRENDSRSGKSRRVQHVS